MKHTPRLFSNLLLILPVFYLLISCQKGDNDHVSDHGSLVKTYPSDVLKAWIKLDLQLLRSNDAKLNNFVMLHHWAYSSVALYEAMVPGMPSYQSLSGELSEMPVMPRADHNKNYHWPTCATTVLAT